MNRQQLGQKTAVFTLITTASLLLVLAVLFTREAPFFASEPVNAVRLGVDELVQCNDPASCTQSKFWGDVRLPSQQISCETTDTPQKARCRVLLDGQSLEFVARFATPQQAEIESCDDATFAGQAVACQPIFHYPVSEVAIVTLPDVTAETMGTLRWRYPLTQFRSADWWFWLLVITFVAMLLISSGAWLVSNGWARPLRLGFTLGSAAGGVLVAGITILVLLTTLHFPID